MAQRRPWGVEDSLLELIEPLLPRPERRFRHPGRRRLDHRKALCGTLFVLYTGLPWEFLPQERGYGSGDDLLAAGCATGTRPGCGSGCTRCCWPGCTRPGLVLVEDRELVRGAEAPARWFRGWVVVGHNAIMGACGQGCRCHSHFAGGPVSPWWDGGLQQVSHVSLTDRGSPLVTAGPASIRHQPLGRCQ